MKWKKLLHKQNAKHFSWPAGWDTAEEIAEQLECSPDRVREHLGPSIRCGEVECKNFTVWDTETGRKITKTGFRIGGRSHEGDAVPEQQKEVRKDRWPFYEGARIRRMDGPSVGIVSGSCIRWENGSVTRPGSLSTRQKLRLA